MRKILVAIFFSTLLLTCLPAQATLFDKTSTWTRYPVVLVPGVFDWDNILGIRVNYFYRIQNAIEQSSYNFRYWPWNRNFHRKTHFIPLNPWQNTHDRARDLKRKLDTLMARNNYDKVNIIAHSHGSTTSRLAIRWMAESARQHGKTNPIASLTTIAGPHFGTPVADHYLTLDEPEQQLIAGLLDHAGNLLAAVSGMFEYMGPGSQSSHDVFTNFSKPFITRFNADYPSAGLPPGAGEYGEGAYAEGARAGNGLGEIRETGDPEAILYYSWTGNIQNKWATALDPTDLIMMVTNRMNLQQGYNGDADGFIPVKSARFGKVINENFYWSHVDEINQFIGITAPGAASPESVFRQHAKRLKQAGR